MITLPGDKLVILPNHTNISVEYEYGNGHDSEIYLYIMLYDMEFVSKLNARLSSIPDVP